MITIYYHLIGKLMQHLPLGVLLNQLRFVQHFSFVFMWCHKFDHMVVLLDKQVGVCLILWELWKVGEVIFGATIIIIVVIIIIIIIIFILVLTIIVLTACPNTQHDGLMMWPLLHGDEGVEDLKCCIHCGVVIEDQRMVYC